VALADHFEYSAAGDPSLNYCLWQYTTSVAAEDKFRAINLLLHSFEYTGLDERAHEFIDAVRDAVGPFRTVFGVKWVDGRMSWEFYFYDYDRQQRTVAINKVMTALEPYLRCPVRVNEQLSYFMFSFDIDAALINGDRDMDIVHMYIGNPGSTVSSGICYEMRETSTTLENFYFFFDAATQQQQAADKISCSVHVDPTQVDLDKILLPQLRDCQTICVANKQDHDCVYFSGVDVTQLLFFMRRLEYPARIIAFVDDNRAMLDHLLFDVGIDYRCEGSDVVFLKSGYFGVF
jgi:hypothetical protein